MEVAFMQGAGGPPTPFGLWWAVQGKAKNENNTVGGGK